ncbi:MAG: PKD domain-containing protein [Bacteroidales bacterium]|nr:PKD domain-containing protein [Bacteroidales bacterium]
MKNIRYISRLAGILAIVLAVNACEPQMADKPEVGAAPTSDQLDFTITPGSDEFNFVIENTSSLTGIASWDFGNGSKGSGNKNVARYPMPGEYPVTLTLVTRGGMATLTKILTQTETDFSVFTDPVYVNLTGGIDDTDGKTWVLDVATRGHLGVGPLDDPTAMTWWAANPYDKEGTGLMDDEITFKLDGFVVTYDNKGVSYMKAYRATDLALASIYL